MTTLDIFTEPDGDPDTLANLGPLRAMAGIFEGVKGDDVHPIEEGSKRDVFVERYELQPIDRQTNGPQLFYGLRYHTHIVKPGEVETFHDQVGYWLWEPAAELVTFSLAIPRGQVLLASGHATADATTFSVEAVRGSTINGIASNPFLDEHFTTTHFSMTVTTVDDDHWSYEEVALLDVTGFAEPFEHRDVNTLRRIEAPVSNPLASARDA